MKANVEIYELKVLKGPDGLLRIKAIITESFDLNASISLLAVIVEAVVWKNHALKIDFPNLKLLDSIPAEQNLYSRKAGEMFNGKLGLEISINRRTNSVFKIRFYPEELEFERHVGAADTFLTLNKIAMDDYEFKFTLGNMRSGFDKPPLITKIDFKPI